MNGALLRLALLAVALGTVSSARASDLTSRLVADPKPAVRTDTEQPEVLRSKLASADPALRAWGAWGASLTQKRELAPDVLAALRRTLTEPQVDPHKFVLGALLDAAIRLDLRLSPDDLADLESRALFPSHVLVLASRDPAAHVDLLEYIRQKKGRESKIAADNLLAACAPARTAALLLPEAAIKILVRVYDDETQLLGEGRGWGIGCGTIKVPKGLPPTVRYELVRGTVKDAQLIADGPDPISVLRTCHTGPSIPFSGTTESLDESQHAIDLLRWITGDRAKEGLLAAEISIDHPWTNGSNYVAKVGEDVQLRRAAWRTLLAALVEREFISSKSIPAADPIQVEVEDLRKDQTVPLPELPR